MSHIRKQAVVSSSEAREVPYPYVFVSGDGTVRELNDWERRYLEEEFSPYDGARPSVKARFDERDGWGSIKGFCHRSTIPAGQSIVVAPANDQRLPMSRKEFTAWLSESGSGFEISERPDGTIEAKRIT